jgi:F-type H+-transporting ATPase subunit b
MKGSLPQFDLAFFPSQIFWTVISFGLLYLVVRYLLAPRMNLVLDGRMNRIQQDLELAKEMRQQADVLRREMQNEVGQAHRDAIALLTRQNREISQMLLENEQRLMKGINEQLLVAEAKIAAAKKAAISDAEAAAGQIASKMLEQAMAVSAQKSLIADAHLATTNRVIANG